MSYLQCNSCNNNNCDGGAGGNCKRFIASEPFKLPMLVHVMSQRDVTPVYNLLELFGFKVMERLEPPYFFLSVGK